MTNKDTSWDGFDYRNVGVYNKRRYESAIETAAKAWELACKIGDKEGEVGALVDQGNAHLQSGKVDKAHKVLCQALAAGKAAGLQTLTAKAYSYLADVDLTKGDFLQAFEHSAQAIQVGGGLDEKVWLTHYLACKVVNKKAEAKKALSTAYALVQRKAGKIQDVKLRHSFLNNVTVVREIVEAWKKNAA